MEELVVLVDEQNNPIGTAPKLTVHTTDTPLHRAFSLFLFNSKNELLVTKRAIAKKTFPGVWTNTLCGHLLPDETSVHAATRRLLYELGVEGVIVKEVAPYRYRFADSNGIVENEICPILMATADVTPQPYPDEIDDWKWMPWEAFLTEIRQNPDTYSPWSAQEAAILATKFPLLINQAPL